jgi:hypothetical protein
VRPQATLAMTAGTGLPLEAESSGRKGGHNGGDTGGYRSVGGAPSDDGHPLIMVDGFANATARRGTFPNTGPGEVGAVKWCEIPGLLAAPKPG